VCVCVCVCVCVLTFQSMVEKKAWRLISSTPSGPAPEDTDQSDSFNLAGSFSIVFTGSTHSHVFSLSGFSRCDLSGCQNVNRLKLCEECYVRINTSHSILQAGLSD